MVAPTNPDPLIGARVGNAVVIRLLGEGGMGAVYEAENKFLGKRYAVKVVLRDVLGDAANAERNVERFFLEARAAAKLEHPRIVSVVDCGYLEDGRPFQVMPFLVGRDLDKHCWEAGGQWGHPGRLPVAMAMNLIGQLLDGLAAVHDAGILHRDLKGPNIYVLEDGTIKILDFGLAKLFDPSVRVKRLTGTFQVLGTIGYMAPEQGKGWAVDVRTDIWAVGVIMYRMLTARLPFRDDDFVEYVVAASKTTPVHPSELVSEIPRAVGDVVMACLSADADLRPRSVPDLAHRLMDAFPEGRALFGEVAKRLAERSGPGDPTVKAQTTLGGAAGAVTKVERPPRRTGIAWPVIIGAVLGGVATGGVAVPFATRRNEGASPHDAGLSASSAAIHADASATHLAPPDASIVAPVDSSSAFAIAASPDAAPVPAIPPDAAPTSVAPDAGAPVAAPRPEHVVARTTGTLVVVAKPWGDVWIDGRHAGTTPLGPVPLVVGKHALAIQGPNGVERVPVIITEHHETRISRNWEH